MHGTSRRGRTWQGPRLPGKNRRGLVAKWGLALFYPMLPASSESVNGRFPCPAGMKAFFPVRSVKKKLQKISGSGNFCRLIWNVLCKWEMIKNENKPVFYDIAAF